MNTNFKRLGRRVYETFDRVLYHEIVKDVRTHIPEVKLRDAWVYKVGRDHWEFHYQKFYWHGSASGAYEARAKGWSAYLSKNDVEEYKPA